MSALADISDPGVLLLLSRIEALQAQVLELRDRLPAVTAEATATPTREEGQPFTAEQLCVHWKIPGGTPELMLHNLAKRAKKWGLRPLQGTRGWDALYAPAAVLHAESYADGQIKRRRHAA